MSTSVSIRTDSGTHNVPRQTTRYTRSRPCPLLGSFRFRESIQQAELAAEQQGHGRTIRRPRSSWCSCMRANIFMRISCRCFTARLLAHFFRGAAYVPWVWFCSMPAALSRRRQWPLSSRRAPSPEHCPAPQELRGLEPHKRESFGNKRVTHCSR